MQLCIQHYHHYYVRWNLYSEVSTAASLQQTVANYYSWVDVGARSSGPFEHEDVRAD
jgi:hypothetical protein